MTRQEFISQAWLSYPSFPEGTSFFGRLHGIHRGAEWQVTLSREEKKNVRHFSKLFLLEAPDVQLDSILKVGDLIAVMDGGEVVLLAPCLKKMPVSELHWEYLILWPEYVHWVREFFRERSFLEITTPQLVICPGTEPTLDYFSTELIRGSQRERRYLPTSPELHLKKALALGAEKIFEIKTCFRNGEVTEHHQPEFTMIEWYRAYDSLLSIQKDVESLIQYLHRKIPRFKKPANFKTSSVQRLFEVHCGFELKPDTDLQQLKDLASKLGVDARSAVQIDDFFFLIFMEKIEREMNPETVLFVDQYPPYQAALARLTKEGWGDRMEVYWQNLEIANAFHELNDPVVQGRRFAEDLLKKKVLKKAEVPLDDEFLRCLEAGMPPSSGIALGLERLFMALTGAKNISQTRMFPVR